MFSFIGVGGSRRGNTLPPPAPGRGSISINSHVQNIDPAASASSASTTTNDGRPRLIAKEGWMSKEGDVWKTMKDRYFRLNGTTLSYYTEKGEVKGVIHLQGALVRESLRKGFETFGFELVINPTPASLQGQLLLASNGEIQYPPSPAAAAATIPASASASSSSSDGAASPQPPEERVYYLCMPSSELPLLASEHRKEWISALRYNISFDQRLRSWTSEREEHWSEEVLRLKKEIETIRAKYEMEEFTRQTEEKERKAQEKVSDEQAHADKALMSGSLTSDELLIALKRKNLQLESDVRMILSENEQLKTNTQDVASKLSETFLTQHLSKLRIEMEMKQVDLQNELTTLKEQLVRSNEQYQQCQNQLAATVAAAATNATNAAAELAAAQAAAAQAQAQLQQIQQQQQQSSSVPSDVAIAPSSPSSSSSSVFSSGGVVVDEIMRTQTPALGVSVLDNASSDATILPVPSSPPRRKLSAAEEYQAILAQTTTTTTTTPSNSGTPSAPTPAAPAPAQPAPSSSASSTTSSPSQPTAATNAPSTQPASSSAGSVVPPPSFAPTVAPAVGSPFNGEKCKCECPAPCVNFFAHKSALMQVNALDNRCASLAMERQQFEQAANRYRTEKKVLKLEVMRLRNIIQNGNTTTTTATTNGTQ